MATVRAVLLTGTMGLVATLAFGAGDHPINGGAPIGAAGSAPVGATGRLPIGGASPAFTGSGYRGGSTYRGGDSSGFFASGRPSGSAYRGNSNHGHSYGSPQHRYGAVAPFFYGLPYDGASYFGYDDSGYYYPDGPGPMASDPFTQQVQIQQNMLADEIHHLNAKIEELQQGQGPQIPPPPYAAPTDAEPPIPPAPPVVVVLRNGQRFESNSYAVMDQTFWDFSKTPVRRVAMMDVDVPASVAATAKVGAEFPE